MKNAYLRLKVHSCLWRYPNIANAQHSDKKKLERCMDTNRVLHLKQLKQTYFGE